MVIKGNSAFDYEDLNEETTPLIHGQNLRPKRGLSWILAAAFIVADMAGSGILAIPYAMESTGYAGFFLLVMFGGIAGTTAVLLGRCWDILQERYEEYSTHTRDPFAAIGYRALGNPGRIATSIVNNLSMFGTGVVFTILASQLIQSLVNQLGLDMSYCIWILVVAGTLAPLTWLGTPSDMWPLGIIAGCTTLFACILTTVNLIILKPSLPEVSHHTLEVEPFMMAFGTIAYTFSGHMVLPTIQHDMRKPSEFTNSAILAFALMLLMYLPVSIAGFVVLGDKITDNILVDIEKYYPGPIIYSVQIFILIHLIFAFVIVTNPIYQEIEKIVKAPLHFNWKRVLVRTTMVACIAFMAESVPRFGAVLSLIGGSLITMQCYIFPPLFYMRLCDTPGGWKRDRSISIPSRVLLIAIIVIGLVSGVCATYSALVTIIAPDTFVPPCYMPTNSNNRSILPLRCKNGNTENKLV